MFFIYLFSTSTKITEANLPVFVYKLFHDDFSPILGTNYSRFILVDLLIVLPHNFIIPEGPTAIKKLLYKCQ